MLNNNNPAICYQFTKNEPAINFCSSSPINNALLSNSHYNNISWDDICSKITNINPEIFFNSVTPVSQVQLTKLESIDETKSGFPSYIEKSVSHSKNKSNFSIRHLNRKLKSENCQFRKSKISALKLKSLISKENMNILPDEVQQNLIQLMPECDKVLNNHEKLQNNLFSLSKTSLNNEFFNQALSNFFFKATKKKSTITIESFIENLKSISKNFSENLLSIKKSKTFTDSDSTNENSPNSVKQDNISIKFDYDINVDIDKLLQSHFESAVTFINNQINCDKEFQIKNQKDQKSIVNNSFKSVKSDSIPSDDFSKIKDEESPAFFLHQSNHSLAFNSESSNFSKCSKYKRKNSGSATAPSPNKRPTRSTAGQLPARLKSISPPSPIQKSNTQFNHLSLINTSVSIRGKYKEKQKSKSNKAFKNSLTLVKDNKHDSLDCDTILYNLRNKLSKRLQRNCPKYFNDPFSKNESIVSTSDINSFSSKSPCSLSPGSDKLSFFNSPFSKTSQNDFHRSKLKSSLFENQPGLENKGNYTVKITDPFLDDVIDNAPNSPQWSFSSEFTSQSSIDSVLSQKNIKLEDDLNAIENLLEDVDSEEMPPPRRTLTVATMREKMRAKKMAKEEKRKDSDKDNLSDSENKNLDQMVDLAIKHSSSMSIMMSMPRENPSDDENLQNEFDSFLIDDNEIDDYHVEIDDKILNYSDDLDELLLTSGNESLLEIIMKDPDAMETDTENFNSHNNEMHVSNQMLSEPDNVKGICLTTGVSCSNITNNSSCVNSTSKFVENLSASDSSIISVDNPVLLSQTLTSVIQKVSNNIHNSKDVTNIKGSIPNAYLVDGNGLSDALKLIQSLNPGAKVTTQQFYLVNSGPQLILCQTPPTQASSTCPVNSKSPIKSTLNTTQIISTASSNTTQPNRNISSFNNVDLNNANKVANSAFISNPKSIVSSNPNPILSSAISVLPQFSPVNSKSQNLFSLNSNFQNKIVTPITNLNNKLNNKPSITTEISSATNILQQSSIFSNQKSMVTNVNSNTLGIRLQLTQNSQPLSFIQSAHNSLIPTIVNQQLQFLTPQPNNNISLITQPQPMSKLVLLCPNLNCQPIGSDINNSLKSDPQQLIFVSPQKEQNNSIPLTTNSAFQVLNGPNIWHQINPNFGTIIGSTNNNNLVLMNPQTINNQSFSFNYQPQSQIITANNLLIMSSNNFSQINTNQKSNHNPKTVNTGGPISANNKYDDDNQAPTKTPRTLNTNSNHNNNSSMEILSNSSSSANSKLSTDDKSTDQLNKSFSENMTDSDGEKSINSSSLFQLFNSDFPASTLSKESNSCQSTQTNKCRHLTVDIDSVSPTNSLYQSMISNKLVDNSHSTCSQNDDFNTVQSSPPLQPDYDQSDYEIPCVYSSKLQITQNNLINKTEENIITDKINDIADF